MCARCVWDPQPLTSCPVATSGDMVQLQPRPFPTQTMTIAALTPSPAVLPDPNCCLVRPPAWERRTRLAFCRARREGGKRLGWWGALRGGSPAGPSAICCRVPPLPAPSSFRLRVHHSGDPWELEANFPRSLVMERPQVLPLIKVKRGTEETRCAASFSHL